MYEIDDRLREEYDRSGVICLRQAFDDNWIGRMRAAMQLRIDRPGSRAADFNDDPNGQAFFGDMFMWRDNPDFRRAALEGPAPQIAAGLFGLNTVNFFYDQAFVKEPGTTAKTPWHQDLPYWPVQGNQITTVWVALDSVTPASGAVDFVAGSHKWGTLFRPVPFGAPNEINRDYENSAFEEIPNIDAARDRFDIINFEMQAGDCLVFDARIVHGAPGNATNDRRRRAVALRYVGADGRFAPRPGTFPLPQDPGLAAGETLTCDLFPAIQLD